MRNVILIAACLLVGACSSPAHNDHPQRLVDGSNPIAKSNIEAIHNADVIPLPLHTDATDSIWKIGEEQPRMDFGSSISNYRVFSIKLKQGEHYNLNVRSSCLDDCLGVSKYALKPRAMLMDAYGIVIAGKPSRAASEVGSVSLGWEGEAPEDGTYYLLVAADNEDTGKAIVIDNIWLNNSPLMSVQVGMNSPSFSEMNAYATESN
ncbi:hypothetical protein [Pseudomonas marincola]|uniref:hypothetical protein n=1 Tax=Pseudomonas marincola TaxID=437900 RepID=UPI0008E3ADA5|nr:hypothetical protein [Pseudomonas marincola]SFU04267.1 hypothetical protein SAMN05216264_10981 [Pseudomonas marincola]